MNVLVNNEKCFGCSSCKVVCSNHAITMKEDKMGFIVPFIDNNLCVECGKCLKVCPIDKHIEVTNNRFFGMKLNDDRRFESTSGGVFRALAEAVLSEDGIVIGSSFDENMHLSYTSADSLMSLKKLLGTKYVQSDPNDIFYTVEDALKQNKKVLFFGNPCTAHGLKLFLKNRFGSVPNKLLLVDHVCFGVPAPGFFRKYLEYLESVSEGKVTEFVFRAKEKADSAHTVTYKVEDNSKSTRYYTSYLDNPYLKIYSRGISIRKSCSNCQYCSVNRVSDITLGDYWGIEKSVPGFDDGYGVSLVLTHTKAGEDAIVNVLNDFSYFETSLDKAKQPRLVSGGKQQLLNKLFLNEMQKNGVENCDMETIIKKYGH